MEVLAAHFSGAAFRMERCKLEQQQHDASS
jgi:hypothetical protein